MKNKNSYLFLLGLIVIFLSIEKYRTKVLSQNKVELLKKRSDIQKSLSFMRDYYLELSIENNGKPLDKFIEINDGKKNISTFEGIVNSKKLVFRYTELHCDVCVDKQIEAIKKISKKIGKKNIIILTEYENLKNLIIFKRLNSLSIPIFNLQNKFNLPIEELDSPYYFVVDKDFVIKDLFIPIKEIENYTNKYLNIIYKKHFS